MTKRKKETWTWENLSRKHPIAFLAIIIISPFLLLFFIVMISVLLEEAGILNNQIEEAQLSLVTKSPIDMLPIREEIATEWKIYKRENYTMDEEGFDSGAYLEIDRMEGLSMSVGYIWIYKFNNFSDADLYYQKDINKTKQKGGYTKISSPIKGECFAIKGGDYVVGYYKWVRCKKANIIFSIEVTSFVSWRTSYYKDLTKTVAKKIG